MKKEKMKQICNYFMKGLLLCALVFGFWFMADAGVNAMEHGINIDRTGNVELIPLTQKDDGTLNYLNVTNSTGKAIKVTFEDTTPSTAYKKGDIWVGNHRYQWGNSVRNFIYMYPGQSIKRACKVEFGVYDRKAETSITVKAEVLSKAQYIKTKEQSFAYTKSKALEIPLSGMQYSLYDGITYGIECMDKDGISEEVNPGKDERWYKFNVSERAVINPTFELAEKERCNLFHQNQTFIKIYNSRDELMYSEAATQYKGENIWNMGSKTLTSGTYYVQIINNRHIYHPATFMFNLNGHNWISANKVTCSQSAIQLSDIGKKKVIAQTVPANSDDKIVSVYDHLTGKTWDWYNSNKVDYDGIPSSATAPGKHKWITFKTTNGKTFTTYVISPAEKLKKPRVATGYNSAKFWIDYPNKLQTSVRIQVLKKGKWTTAKTIGYFSCGNSNPVTIKGLKPLTNYKFRVQAYANGMTGTPSNIVTMKTGSKVKPAVKSIKIVQRKKVTVKGWWRKHWVGGHISRYEWVPPYTYTKYKVKVTLKKKVPKIGGMWVATNWVKGSKKSYTVWVPNGAQKGKKLTIRISTALGKGYGNGPEVKKVIRVK